MSVEVAFPDKKQTLRTSFGDVTSLAQKIQDANEHVGIQTEALWVVPIDYPTLPIAVLFATDIHFGGDIDYQRLSSDLALVSETPNTYLLVGGDYVHNMTAIGKPNEDLIKPELQLSGFFDIVHLLDEQGKLGGLQLGDHDSWSEDKLWQYLSTLHAPIFPGTGGILNIVLGNFEYRIGMVHKYPGRSESNITYPGKQALYRRFAGVHGVLIGNDHRLAGEIFVSDSGTSHFIINGGTYLRDNGSAGKGSSGMCVMLWPDKSGYALMDLEHATEIIRQLAKGKRAKKGFPQT